MPGQRAASNPAYGPCRGYSGFIRLHVYTFPAGTGVAGRPQGAGGRHGSEVTKIRIQVPQEPNNFVGRERELTELCELLGVTRALTLCGPGGIGKTRLAQRLVFTVAGAFPDGVC